MNTAGCTHKCLGRQRPSNAYEPSRGKNRNYKLQYSAHYEQRKINNSDEIQIGGMRCFINEIFKDDSLGLRRIKDDTFEVYTGTLYLGVLPMFPVAQGSSYPMGNLEKLSGSLLALR